MYRLFILTVLSLLVGCSTPKSALPPPTLSVKPPTANANDLGINISSMEKSLQGAASRIERIQILVDSLPTP